MHGSLIVVPREFKPGLRGNKLKGFEASSGQACRGVDKIQVLASSMLDLQRQGRAPDKNETVKRRLLPQKRPDAVSFRRQHAKIPLPDY